MTQKTTTPKHSQPTSPVAPNTPADQFRDSLNAKGMTLKDWAEERNYNPEYCSRVLCGLVKGKRGLGHEIAVAMGIKSQEQSA